MKVTFEVGRHTLDWVTFKDIEIETDDYNYFIIQCRGNEAEWYLTGYKWNQKIQKWDYEDFSVWYLWRMVQIYHQIKNKVKQIDVLHFHGNNDSIEQFFKKYNKYLEQQEKVQS